MTNIIAKPDIDAGLCNRIKCIISAMHEAEQSEGRLCLDWTPSFSCGAEFSDLFDNAFPYEKEGTAISTWKFPDIPKEKILEYLARLKIKNSISDEADAFFSYEFSPQSTVVGVHVRRNEFLLNSEKKKSTDELFFRRMDGIIEKNPEVLFFLATDSTKAMDDFIGRYGERIITYHKDCLDRSKTEAIRQALVELLILSKCNLILGSHLSTYSEMAWWLGACKAEIEMIGKPEVETIRIEDQKTSRISSANQWLRRNSGLYRWMMRLGGYWA